MTSLPQMLQVEIVEADLNKTEHQHAVVELIDAFAVDPMSNGKPLSAEVRRDLIPKLQQHPTTIIFLAYQGGGTIGIAVCFLGFSTFAARPLINIHDLLVLPEHRGQGTGRRLLEEIERKARDLGCCKITLEVGKNNHIARQVYESAGFANIDHQEAALFLSKPL